jgi:hypothetical protein
MNRALLALLAGLIAAVSAFAQLPPVQNYSSQGELIVTQFVTAPFPHPQRAEGHQYHNEFYSAKDHYSDSTVAIFIPKQFRETRRVDFVVHFHGWRNHVTKVLERYQLIAQLIDSGRNAVLVVPQGPYDAPDSFGGKLEDPGGFKRFMDEVTDTLRRRAVLKSKQFEIGNIILSAHSGGYEVVAAILDHGGLTDHINGVWLFDALYAHTDWFLAWFRKDRRFFDIYTEHGGTKEETERLMATLKQRGTPFFAGKESEINPAVLRTNKLVFIYTDLPHDDVVSKHRTFEEFLKASVQ